jgi:hypothetical protein
MSRECCQQAVNVNYSISPSNLSQVFVEHHFKVHVSSITAKNREDWIHGLRDAFATFLDKPYGGVFSEHNQLLSFHCYKDSTTITSIPCKFRGKSQLMMTGSQPILCIWPLLFRDGHALEYHYPIPQRSQAYLLRLISSAELASTTLVPPSNSKMLRGCSFRRMPYNHGRYPWIVPS